MMAGIITVNALLEVQLNLFFPFDGTVNRNLIVKGDRMGIFSVVVPRSQARCFKRTVDRGALPHTDVDGTVITAVRYVYRRFSAVNVPAGRRSARNFFRNVDRSVGILIEAAFRTVVRATIAVRRFFLGRRRFASAVPVGNFFSRTLAVFGSRFTDYAFVFKATVTAFSPFCSLTVFVR